MQNCHIALPSAAAAVRSVGVVTRYNGDFDTGLAVSKRTDAFCGVVPVGVTGGMNG